ncbi:MAG: 50S ribosomal protein L11 methyltransferase [Ignavibacteriae bacterium]|nr:50S ribosomal protein L11 methyltransferase [Ignavibacteriota bacterium]
MTKKLFLEVSVSASPSQQELLLPTLLELGSQGFLETESELKSYFDVTSFDELKSDAFKTELKKLVREISSNAVLSYKTFQEENWNEQWEQTIQPIEIGNRLVIKPSWSDYQNVHNRIVICIDPKMSFGTGYHETTRLTLLLLTKYLKQNSTILDVGTGTGVLAIAGIKLGAISAVGIDIDEWSIDNAKENVVLNNVHTVVQIQQNEIQDLPLTTFDIITANLTLNTNIDLMKYFQSFLSNNGILLLSGLLLVDRTKMIESLLNNQFEVLEELTENEWLAIAARKVL